MSGVNLNYFLLEERPLIHFDEITVSINKRVLSITFHPRLYANIVNRKKNEYSYKEISTIKDFSFTHKERLRNRVILDAVVAYSYGLNFDDLKYILKQCDYPLENREGYVSTEDLDPKGFWRIDKDRPPELRHTVLTLVAFAELEKIGIEKFLTMNDGEGWMLPETVRLSDYGLGHDSRAKEEQPVAPVLGERFLSWQMELSPEESWKECELHAELINAIVPSPYSDKDVDEFFLVGEKKTSYGEKAKSKQNYFDFGE